MSRLLPGILGYTRNVREEPERIFIAKIATEFRHITDTPVISNVCYLHFD